VPAAGPPRGLTGRSGAWNNRVVRLRGESCEDQYGIIEPHINASGVHSWAFNPAFPIDFRFLTSGRRYKVRMNRHDYFEIVYLCAGSAVLNVQDRSLPFREGELAVVGSTIYHSIDCNSISPLTMAVLFFHPDLIRSDGGPDNAEYLTPFLLQDSQFPHVVPARSGIPSEVFKFMQRIRDELPAGSPRQRLTAKTYLKVILMLLVNQYSSYRGTTETFQRQQLALERLRPLFNYLETYYGEPIQVRQAARICGMSESHFMSFFKRATGQSFMAYLNHCRIERAQALLLTTDKSMSEISQQTGFCDQSYFGTVFRRLIGMPPAAYRRRFYGSGDGALTHADAPGASGRRTRPDRRTS
jgi:AraC-like DNA-binding protein